MSASGADDRFRLFSVGYAADRDHRDPHRRLDRAGGRNLIVRADWDVLRRREAAAGDVDGGAAARPQRLEEGDRLRQVQSLL